MLVNDPLFSKEGVKFFAETGSGGRRSEPNPAGRRDRNLRRGKQSLNSYATGMSEKDKKNEVNCYLCDGTHKVEDCQEIIGKTVEERSKIIGKKKLCYGCLEPMTKEHNAKTCKQRLTCKTCGKSHPTVLHGYTKKVRSDTSTSVKSDIKSPVSCISTCLSHEVLSMCILPIEICCDKTKSHVKTYAMLDNCSQGTFIKESLTNDLKISGLATLITVRTLNGEETIKTQAIEGLKAAQIGNEDKKCWINLPKCFTRDSLPVDSEEIITPDQIKRWEYLDGIATSIPDKNVEVGLIIGVNCVKALEPLEFIPSKNNGPYAFKTVLGWCVVGPVETSKTNKTGINCNLITVQQAPNLELAKHSFAAQVRVKDVGISKLLKKLYEADFTEANPKAVSKVTLDVEEMSTEDRRFLELMDAETKKIGKHYVLPLPFKNSELSLPNNRKIAEKRAASLKYHFLRDEKYWSDYKAFIQDLLNKGYARKSAGAPAEGKCWYIPHHGVYHPHKPKIRVVFDCSSKYNDRSLNSELMPGPDLNNLLVGVLIRFRQEKIAFMGDTEAMFYQVRVTEEHCSFLKFLWWENHDLEKPPDDHELLVHLQGGTSSPGCSTYALKRSFIDYEAKM